MGEQSTDPSATRITINETNLEDELKELAGAAALDQSLYLMRGEEHSLYPTFKIFGQDITGEAFSFYEDLKAHLFSSIIFIK